MIKDQTHPELIKFLHDNEIPFTALKESGVQVDVDHVPKHLMKELMEMMQK